MQEIRYAGEIALSFKNRGGRTVADRIYRHGNSRVSANIPAAGDIPYYFLISTGGGFTEGEIYRQEVELEEDTHVILTTQTPSYIYKCENGRTTEQRNILRIGKNGLLEYYIDEIIPYRNAIFRQDTEIWLGEGSSLILTDGLTAGWSPDEKPFQYGQVGLRTRIRRGEKLLMHDYLLVDPREDPMAEIGYFEGNRSYHSAVIMDPEINEKVLAAMRDAMQELRTDCRFGMSLLEEEGAVLRVLGESADKSRAVLAAWIRYYRENIRGYAPLDLRKHNYETGKP